jgi:hypothetical protein
VSNNVCFADLIQGRCRVDIEPELVVFEQQEFDFPRGQNLTSTINSLHAFGVFFHASLPLAFSLLVKFLCAFELH